MCVGLRAKQVAIAWSATKAQVSCWATALGLPTVPYACARSCPSPQRLMIRRQQAASAIDAEAARRQDGRCLRDEAF